MAHRSCPRLSISITVDVDADANRAVSGRPDAVSAGTDVPRYKACLLGLGAVHGALEERGLPATFFWEARAVDALSEADDRLLDTLGRAPNIEHGCHSLRHEDFAGKVTGQKLSRQETHRILRQATDRLTPLTGPEPTGFRAPYCRLTPAVRRVLAEMGYAYDASLTADVSEGDSLQPRGLDGGGKVLELPLCRARDETGRPISSYLWQLFEGNREPDEYVAMARNVAAAAPAGLLQMALHPWHLFVGADGRPSERGPERLGTVLDGLQELDGVVFTTNEAYLAKG